MNLSATWFLIAESRPIAPGTLHAGGVLTSRHWIYMTTTGKKSVTPKVT